MSIKCDNFHKVDLFLVKQSNSLILLTRESLVFVSGREKIEYLSYLRSSFCGQVVCHPHANSSFCRRQISRSHGNRLVVTSLVINSPFCGSMLFHFQLWFAYILYCHLSALLQFGIWYFGLVNIISILAV